MSRALLGGYYFCYFAAQAAAGCCMNLYLTRALGFSGVQLGWFYGLSALVTAAALPAIGQLADRTGRSGWLLTAALTLTVLAADRLRTAASLLAVLLWGGAWECGRSACVALADRLAMGICPAGRYGGVRAFGSLGFLVGGLAMGGLVERFGVERALFPVYLALGLGALGCSFGLHAPLKPAERSKLGLRKLLSIPEVRLSLWMGALGSVAVGSLQPYAASHLVEGLGAPERMLGWNTLCCVAPECVLLPLVSRRALPRWGERRLFAVTTLALCLRCALYALAPGAGVFLLGSLLYGLSVCSYTAVNLSYLRRNVPGEQYAGAVLMSASAAALGRAVFGWGFGAASEYWGGTGVFWLLFAAAVVTLPLLRKEKD